MPNTKTKKFDFQIFLAVSMILLVICCATVCVVLSNNETGVAHAVEPVFDTWNVTGGFYLKKITTMSDFQSIIGYYFNFIPEVQNPKIGEYVIGKLRFTYINTSNSLETVDLPLSVCVEPFEGRNGFYIKIYNPSRETSQLLVSIINFDSTIFTSNYWEFYATSSTDNYNFYSLGEDFTQTNTFINQFLTFALGSVTNIKSLETFTFSTYLSIHWIVSQTETFENIPLFPGSYNDGYKDAVNELQPEIDRLNGIIESKDKTIDYYEALMPQTETVAVFDISKCVPSTFVYNGITYSSDTIKPIDGGGWDVYDSRYNNKELPPNQSVGFSLLLTETLNNTKIHVNPSIQPWYSYSYDGGSRLDKLASFSVGYRNQNGQIVKLGNVMVDLVGNTEFIINQPTNEIVFFASENNRLEIGKGMGVSYYKVNTQVLYDEAYAEGYKTGYGYGKYVGKNEGIAQANDYSFFSLFSAVFDAPITAIVGRWGDSDGDGVYEREGGMLNFYIPGLEINFAPFLLSMFTIAIIVMIIRFILARKS